MNVLRQRFRKSSSDSHIPTDRLVTPGHFRSRDKDGGHTVGPGAPEHPMSHANLMALSVMQLELWAIDVYIAGIGISIGISDLFAPVTLTLTR